MRSGKSDGTNVFVTVSWTYDTMAAWLTSLTCNRSCTFNSLTFFFSEIFPLAGVLLCFLLAGVLLCFPLAGVLLCFPLAGVLLCFPLSWGFTLFPLSWGFTLFPLSWVGFYLPVPPSSLSVMTVTFLSPLQVSLLVEYRSCCAKCL